MSDNETRQRRGNSVPHHGKWVYDVTTRKWYEVRKSEKLGVEYEVWLHPPGGFDARHMEKQDFVAEIGSRLLLRRVTTSMRKGGDWEDTTGSMAYSVFTDDMGLPDDALTCPNCGAACEDGHVRMHHTFVSYEDGEAPTLHCSQCRANWSVDPDRVDA